GSAGVILERTIDELVEVVDEGIATRWAHPSVPGRRRRAPVSPVIERVHGEAGLVQRARKSVVPTRVFRRAMRDHDDADRMRVRPPPMEDVDAVPVPERSFV